MSLTISSVKMMLAVNPDIVYNRNIKSSDLQTKKCWNAGGARLCDVLK